MFIPNALALSVFLCKVSRVLATSGESFEHGSKILETKDVKEEKKVVSKVPPYMLDPEYRFPLDFCESILQKNEGIGRAFLQPEYLTAEDKQVEDKNAKAYNKYVKECSLDAFYEGAEGDSKSYAFSSDSFDLNNITSRIIGAVPFKNYFSGDVTTLESKFKDTEALVILAEDFQDFKDYIEVKFADGDTEVASTKSKTFVRAASKLYQYDDKVLHIAVYIPKTFPWKQLVGVGVFILVSMVVVVLFNRKGSSDDDDDEEDDLEQPASQKESSKSSRRSSK